MDLQIEVVSGADGERGLAVSGEVDVATAGQLADALTDCIEAGEGTVRVDISAVTLIDSSGLGALVVASEALRRNGRVLELRRPQAIVTKALTVTGLDQILTVDDEH